MISTLFLCLPFFLFQSVWSIKWPDERLPPTHQSSFNVFKLRDGWGHWSDANVQPSSQPGPNVDCATVTSTVTVPGAGATIFSTVTAVPAEKTVTISVPAQQTITLSELEQKTTRVSGSGQITVTATQPGQDVSTTVIFISTSTVASTTVTTTVKETSFSTTITVASPGEKASTTITTTSYVTLNATQITIIQTSGTPGSPIPTPSSNSTLQLDQRQKQTYQDICVGVYRNTTPWWATLLLVLLFLFGSLILAALALLMFAKKPWTGRGSFAAAAAGGIYGACGQSCAGSPAPGICGACGQSCAACICAKLEKSSKSTDEAETYHGDQSGTCVWCGHSSFSCGGPILPILRVCGQSVDIDRSNQDGSRRVEASAEHGSERYLFSEGRRSHETQRSHNITYSNETEHSYGAGQVSEERRSVLDTRISDDEQRHTTMTGWKSEHEHVGRNDTEYTMDAQIGTVRNDHGSDTALSRDAELESKEVQNYNSTSDLGVAIASGSEAYECKLPHSNEQNLEDSDDQSSQRRTFDSVRTYDSDQDFGGGLTSFFVTQRLKSHSAHDEVFPNVIGEVDTSRRSCEGAQKKDIVSMRESVQMLEKKHIVTGRHKNMPRAFSSLSETSSYDNKFKSTDRRHEYGESVSSERSSTGPRVKQSSQLSEIGTSVSSSPKHSYYSDFSSTAWHKRPTGGRGYDSGGSLTSEYESDRSKVFQKPRLSGIEVNSFAEKYGYKIAEKANPDQTDNIPSRSDAKKRVAGLTLPDNPFIETSNDHKAIRRVSSSEDSSRSQTRQAYSAHQDSSDHEAPSQKTHDYSVGVDVIPTPYNPALTAHDDSHKTSTNEQGFQTLSAYINGYSISEGTVMSSNVPNHDTNAKAMSDSQILTARTHDAISARSSNFNQSKELSLGATTEYCSADNSYDTQADNSIKANVFISQHSLTRNASSTESHGDRISVSVPPPPLTPMHTFTSNTRTCDQSKADESHTATYADMSTTNTNTSVKSEADTCKTTSTLTLKRFPTRLIKSSTSYSDYDEDDLEFFNNHNHIPSSLTKSFPTTLTKISESHDLDHSTVSTSISPIPFQPHITTTTASPHPDKHTTSESQDLYSSTTTMITQAQTQTRSKLPPDTLHTGLPRHASITITDLGSFPSR